MLNSRKRNRVRKCANVCVCGGGGCVCVCGGGGGREGVRVCVYCHISRHLMHRIVDLSSLMKMQQLKP